MTGQHTSCGNVAGCRTRRGPSGLWLEKPESLLELRTAVDDLLPRVDLPMSCARAAGYPVTDVPQLEVTEAGESRALPRPAGETTLIRLGDGVVGADPGERAWTLAHERSKPTRAARPAR